MLAKWDSLLVVLVSMQALLLLLSSAVRSPAFVCVHVMCFSLRAPKKPKTSKRVENTVRGRNFFDTFLPEQKKRTLASVAIGQSLKAAAATAAAKNSSARVSRGKVLEAWLVDAPNSVGLLPRPSYSIALLDSRATSRHRVIFSFLCFFVCLLTRVAVVFHRCATGVTSRCANARRMPKGLQPMTEERFLHRWIGSMAWWHSKIRRAGLQPPQRWNRIKLALPQELELVPTRCKTCSCQVA